MDRLKTTKLGAELGKIAIQVMHKLKNVNVIEEPEYINEYTELKHKKLDFYHLWKMKKQPKLLERH